MNLKTLREPVEEPLKEDNPKMRGALRAQEPLKERKDFSWNAYRIPVEQTIITLILTVIVL